MATVPPPYPPCLLQYTPLIMPVEWKRAKQRVFFIKMNLPAPCNDHITSAIYSHGTQASMLSSKSEVGGKRRSQPGQSKITRRGSMVNRRTGLKAALNISIRAPKPQSLPSYLVKVLLSLVQARLEAQVCCYGFNRVAFPIVVCPFRMLSCFCKL